MLKRTVLILIILYVMPAGTGCTGNQRALFYRPVERSDVDISAGRSGLIRTVYCDIYLEYVDSESYEYLKSNNVFRGRGRGNPADPCFHVIVVNTWNKPFIIDSVDSVFRGEVTQAEDYSFIKDTGYTKTRYALDLSSMMKKRRILSERYLVRDIDYDNDTAEYRLNFIAPGDKVSFFAFFGRVPAGRSSKIRVAIKYLDLKKVIDFDIGRFEYNDIENLQ